jgi:diguanylate cyclase (GGDEF)-like protein/PAS domain S-box-containing protein
MDKRDLNKERLQLALDAAGLDLWENNLASGEVTRNATKIFKELGYSDDESLAYLDDLFAIVHPDDVSIVKAALDAHLTGVTAQYRCEFRVRSKDGVWVWYANYGKIIDSEGGPHGRRFIGVTFNIDDRKQKEVESKLLNRKLADQNTLLYKSEAALLESQLIAGLGTYELDISNGFWKSSVVLDRLFGIGESYDRSVAGWEALLHPDERVMLFDHLNDEVIGQGKKFDKEYRIIRHDDQVVRWLHGLGKLEYDFQGRPVKLHGTIQDITERKHAESMLRAREAQFAAIYHNVSDIVFVINVEPNDQFRFFSVNQRFMMATNLPENQIVGRLVSEVIPEPGHTLATEKYKEAIRDHKVVYWEETSDYPAGQKIGEISIVPMFDAHKNCTQLIGMVHDITVRKQAEGRIKRLGNLYKALSEINQAIVRMETEEMLFPLVCRMAVDFGELKMAWVGKPNEETELFEIKFSYGSGADYLKEITISTNEAVVEGNGPSGVAFRENKLIIINDFQGSEWTIPWHAAAIRFGWESCGVFPILRGGQSFALLGVYHEHKNAFDDEAVKLLDEMVRDVSFALDSFDREKLRREAQANLLSSERHFRAYFERSMVGMAATSPTKGMLEVNDALCKILGYSKEELMGMTWAELTHPDDLEVNENLFDRVLRGDLNEYELDKRFIRKNGEIVYVHVAIRAVRNDDGIVDYFVALVDDITESRNKQRQLELLVHYDTLTGLPNRSLLNDRLEMGLAQVKRTGGNLAVCFMDLDGFKPVNDTFGHEVGDTLLIEVAKRVVATSRATDTVARLGGDEFVLLFPEISGAEECRHMLSRIMETLSQPFNVNGHEIQISASIGIAIYPEDVNDGDSLIRHADQAMYIAKQLGRNRIHLFDAANDQLAQIRSEGLSRVEMALESGELILYYQPKVNMRSGQVIGMEALIRWLHPQRGLLPPGEFMPLIENSDFEIRLSEWVIAQAMTQLTTWQKEGMALAVSVNLPARHLQSHGFTEFIVSVIAKHRDMKASSFELEILETAALGDMGAAIHKMQSCIDLGIHFSIDDFGTGYASLAYLRRLPVHMIKIDQIFVRDMLDDEDDLSIVEGVIGLAKAFKKDVIAEGVETVAHGVKLLNLGCELAQGYGIARPMEAKFVTDWVRNYHLPTDWSRCSE